MSGDYVELRAFADAWRDSDARDREHSPSIDGRRYFGDSWFQIPGTDAKLTELQLRAALDELERLRALLPAATEFTFRPDFGALNDEFSDDPAGRDAVVLSWRGPAAEGADPDRWAITLHGIYCWSRSKAEWTYEPRPSSRDDDFLGDHRFSRDEAMDLMPGLLAEISARRIPELQRMVEARR